MKRYKYQEWDILEGTEYGNWDDRVYVDSDGNLITGVLEGFYGYTADPSAKENAQYVEKGRRKMAMHERQPDQVPEQKKEEEKRLYGMQLSQVIKGVGEVNLIKIEFTEPSTFEEAVKGISDYVGQLFKAGDNYKMVTDDGKAVLFSKKDGPIKFRLVLC